MFGFDLDDRVTAAAVAATGTIIGALIQLRVAWRKEVSDRARGVPMNKKSRRGPVLAVILLLVAAGVGGFAVSQYFVGQSVRDSAALQVQLQSQVAQIGATAERLERASLNEHLGGAADGARFDPVANGGVTVSATIGPCHTSSASSSSGPGACAERDSAKLTLCASVPAAAAVTATALYARPEDSARPWTESVAVPGQDLGRARFEDKTIERADSELARQVCTNFSSWDSDHAFSARMLVRYGPPPAGPETSSPLAAHAASAPDRYARSALGEERR